MGEEDVFSCLPDDMIYHISSFLDIKDVVRLGISSNTWRGFAFSTPFLNFTLQYSCPPPHSPHLHSFLKFIDRISVTSTSKIIKFNLFCGCVKLDPHRLSSWILGAVARQVEHLLLHGSGDNRIHLPVRFFTTCTFVKNMLLEKIVFPGHGELLLSCPSLENLTLRYSDVANLDVLTVSTPRLVHLDICSLYSTTDNSCVVKMSAPRLQSLSVTAFFALNHPATDYCIGNLDSLESASIVFSPTSPLSIQNSARGESINKFAKSFLKLLTGISNVQTLTLSDFSFQLFREFEPERPGVVVFPNLKLLVLVDHRKAHSVHALLYFLERFPHIEAFVWKRDLPYWSSVYHEEDWVEDLPLHRIFRCLKTFEMQNFQGTAIEFKLLVFLLERAAILKDIIIKSLKICLSARNLTGLKEKLLSSPRASSSATISLQLK